MPTINLKGSDLITVSNTASSGVFTLPTVRSEEELKALEDVINTPGYRFIINDSFDRDKIFFAPGPQRTISYSYKPKIKRKKTEKIKTLKDQMKDVPD